MESAGGTGDFRATEVYGANSGEIPVWEHPPRSPSQMEQASAIPSSCILAGKQIRFLFHCSHTLRVQTETQCLDARAENGWHRTRCSLNTHHVTNHTLAVRESNITQSGAKSLSSANFNRT